MHKSVTTSVITTCYLQKSLEPQREFRVQTQARINVFAKFITIPFIKSTVLRSKSAIVIIYNTSLLALPQSKIKWIINCKCINIHNRNIKPWVSGNPDLNSHYHNYIT